MAGQPMSMVDFRVLFNKVVSFIVIVLRTDKCDLLVCYGESWE